MALTEFRYILALMVGLTGSMHCVGMCGAIVILIGLDMLKVLPWRLPLEKIPAKRLRRLYKGAAGKGPLLGSFLGGVLNGFIPCALLYGVLVFAATADSPVSGGLLMAAFGIGTLPSMFFVSFLVGKVGARARGWFFNVAAFIIIFMGLRTVATAYSMFIKIGTEADVTCHQGTRCPLSARLTHHPASDPLPVHYYSVSIGK